jgi:O-antigen ligase
MEKSIKKNHIYGETLGAIFIIIFVSLFILSNLLYGFVWPVYIPAMVVGFFIAFSQPRSGLYAIIFLTIIFERFFTLQSFFIGKVEYKLYPIDILLIAILLGTLITYFVEKTKTVKWKLQDLILLFFILINIIYFFFSAYVLNTSSYLAFSSFKNYAFYSLLYFITFLQIRNISDIKRLFKFFLAGAIFLIGFIIFGILNGEGLWTEYTPLSTSGVRILAFTHGLYLSLALLPTLIFLSLKSQKIKKYEKIFYFLLIIWSVGIIGTMMRHIWVALTITLIFIYFFLESRSRKNFKIIIIKALFSLSVLAILIFYLTTLFPHSKISDLTYNVLNTVRERTESLIDINSDDSFSWRNLVWNSAYQSYRHTPLFGIGTGRTIYVENEYYQDFIEVRNIHNSYLAILIQLGIMGIGLFLTFISITSRDLIKFNVLDLRHYKISLLSILVFYLAVFLFQPYLETNLLALFFWINLGLIRVLPELKDSK